MFACTDTPRANARRTIDRLVAQGVEPLLFSGDRQAVATALGATLGIASVRGDMTPEDKRAAIAAMQARGAVVAMVGDGVNDAPALAQAQVSLSLASATPLAQWTADVVILADTLSPIALIFDKARRTRRVMYENLGWATLYNLIAIPAAVLGWVTPLAAAIGMSASSLVVVLNALRLARAEPDRAKSHRDHAIATG